MSAPEPRAKRIAVINDAFRTRCGLLLQEPQPQQKPLGRYVFTAGVSALPMPTIARVLEGVRRFEKFSPDNDPYGERDFGAIEIEGLETVFWKIDYYADDACDAGSEDPADPKRSYRVLTVMLASEY